MATDYAEYMKKCIGKKHGNLIHEKQEDLHYIFSLWPFVKWGMNIIGPYASGNGQVKFLLVNIDYFTK